MVTNVRKHDAAATEANILQAAAEEFAALGPAGARIDAIAAAAGVNKRMLYHYFGSKAGLYRAVLAEAAGCVGEQSLAATVAQSIDSAEAGGGTREIVVAEPPRATVPQLTSHQLRLFAWAGLEASHESVDNPIPDPDPIAVQPDIAELDEGLLQSYGVLSLQLIAEIGRPLLTQLLGGGVDGARLAAIQLQLHEQISQRLLRAPSAEHGIKPKITLKAQSRSMRDQGR